ncbi:molybdopterin-dependent oxidoreductase [Pigmentiphaga litoralis]|uniref:molybdopterin-dependent oxidoreductase n=1 Tax=Pigmentiphaga litoralis TaxID=516702 RepID=UPI0015C76FB6
MSATGRSASAPSATAASASSLAPSLLSSDPARASSSTPPAVTSTTCPYCGVGCGVQASVASDGKVTVAGDPAHPSNFGRLCVKGSALGETVGLEGRLLHPLQRTEDGLQRVSWDTALDTAASGLRRIIDTHGPDAVALYVSGQLLTEDYYVANKLMKGYVGSANIDTNSRLCMSSAVAGHKRAFGEDLVPVSYADLERADLIVLVGSNTAWCHPILFQRIARMREARPSARLVVIDPRRTATCELADLHLPIKAGTDVWLFNGLLSYLTRSDAVDAAFVGAHTSGWDATVAAADVDCADPAEVARVCEIDLDVLLQFYRMFADTDRTITAFSQGVNQSSAGTDKVNAIINCHLATGRIGRPGAGPFSITGQPNAMGGREVGGLANMLAAHLDLDKADHRDLVQTFWSSPAIASRPGLKAVDLFHAIEAGTVKAVWIIATNPVVSLPDADQVKRALAACELVIVSDIMAQTDTSAFADVLLPALGWGEKDGTVTSSERRISRQRAFLPAPGEARADWQVLCDVATRMGYDGFDFAGPHAIFDEHVRLTGYRNEGDDPQRVRRVLDVSGLRGMDAAQFDGLAPVQWPVTAAWVAASSRKPEGVSDAVSGAVLDAAVAAASADAPRILADHVFSFPDGRARFVPTPPRAPRHAVDDDFPLSLNTGRVRDQWHTMTRTGKSATLASHIAEAFIDIHPQDALRYGVREGGLARIESRWGAMVARVQHGGGMTRGSVFVPIHWNDQFASDARVGAVVNPVVDPVSGEPEFKHTPVRIEDFPVAWYGFVLSRQAVAPDSAAHWTRIQGKQFTRLELAGRTALDDPRAWARALFGATDPDADWLDYRDQAGGVYRAAYVVDDRIEACVFLSPRPSLPSRAWLATLFDQDVLADIDRIGLLAGQPMIAGADVGPIVCSCFGVGRTTLRNAIVEGGLTTPAQVTACVKAGGNCGSCVPEIKKLIHETRIDAAA